MFCVAIELSVKQDQLEAFMPLMLENAAASLRDEPDCHRFDVCTDAARPGDVFLYELYTDEAAFKTHLTMPHFLSFDRQTADMISEKNIRTYGIVAP